MTHVLVVEVDEALRDTLCFVLRDAGYTVHDEATSVEAALAALAHAPQPMLVIWSNAHPSHCRTAAFFARVVADPPLATRHRYLVLSTNPAAMPLPLRADLVHLSAPVLPKPFDLDTMLTAVGGAAAKLAAAPMKEPACEDQLA